MRSRHEGEEGAREREAASNKGHGRGHYDIWFSKLGDTWEENIAGQRIINTIDMSNVRVIFNADMETLGRAGAYHKNDFLGPGIFSSDGPRWKHSRAMIMPLFYIVQFPSIAWAGLIYGINLCWYNVLNGTMSPILSIAPYNFSSSDVGLMYVPIAVNGRKVTTLVDTGATHSFVSKEMAKELGLKTWTATT